VFGVLVAVDLLSKIFIYGNNFVLIPYLVDFISVENDGIAFSLFPGGGLLIVLPTLILIACSCVAWWIWARGSVFGSVAFAMFIAGAVGNAFDRICFGFVRDFIRLSFVPQFAIFNFADICLTFGVIILCVYIILRMGKKDGHK
jgi:signal peptidase II